MPEVWIYKSKNNQIIEIEASGPPLGAFDGYSYISAQQELEKNDVVLLMSDGFIERFNVKKEMLGHKRCIKAFRDLVHLRAEEIINGLVLEGDKWGGARAQDDDITFIVMKIV